jgi:hypothetical protein
MCGAHNLQFSLHKPPPSHSHFIHGKSRYIPEHSHTISDIYCPPLSCAYCNILGICRVSALSRDPPSNDPPDLLIATKVGLVLPPHKPTHVHTLQCRHRSSSSFCHGLCVSHLHLICTRYTHHLLTRPYLKHSWYSHPIELSRMTSSFQ